jgi:hypothetical protein
MKRSIERPRNGFARVCRLALLVVAAGLLAGCETTGSTRAEATKPPDPPMTQRRAAEQCWMKTEKDSAGVNLDKRADAVTKCIDDKLKTAAAPKT